MTPNPVIDILGLSQVAVAGALYGPFSWHARRPKGIRSLHLLKNELRIPFNYNSSNYLFVHGSSDQVLLNVSPMVQTEMIKINGAGSASSLNFRYHPFGRFLENRPLNIIAANAVQ